MPEKGIVKRAPINRAPTPFEVSKWRSLLAEQERMNDKIFALDLIVECLTIRVKFCVENGLSLPFADPADLEQRYLKLKQFQREVNDAIAGAQSHEYGAYWRDNDFDIMEPSQQMGALFIPIAIGVVILAGCFATIWQIEKGHESVAKEYKKLNAATENFLCKDPGSSVCKKWNVVKKEQHIEEKESFGDSLKSGLTKGLTIGVALLAGLIAFTVWRKTS
jgi:hypothetical protein